jgi:hypothetical protein
MLFSDTHAIMSIAVAVSLQKSCLTTILIGNFALTRAEWIEPALVIGHNQITNEQQTRLSGCSDTVQLCFYCANSKGLRGELGNQELLLYDFTTIFNYLIIQKINQ